MIRETAGIAGNIDRVIAQDPLNVALEICALTDVGGGRAVEADLSRRRRHRPRADKSCGDGIEFAVGRRVARIADERAAPDFAGHEPPFMNKRIGATDGADGDAEIEGEIALRRKLGSHWKRTAGDRRLDLVGEDGHRSGPCPGKDREANLSS